MHITSIHYQNFRNLQSPALNLNEGFVILEGENGAGKTNFLEGIYFGLALKKFPESKLRQLFLEGQDFFRIRVGYFQREEQQLQEVYLEHSGDKYLCKTKHNNQEIPRSKYSSFFPIISFTPQDLGLLARSPGTRRRFLDGILVSVSPQYRYALLGYTKALKQRNNLWQKIQRSEAKLEDLELWDEKLAEFGSQICLDRDGFLKYLNTNFPRVISSFSPALAQINFRYRISGATNRNEFLSQLERLGPQEESLGVTIIGPHRDDFETYFNGRSAVGFISRGQTRAVVLALKILEQEYLEEKFKTPPIILLDDIFSEFDSSHQEKLLKFLERFNQVFFTTTHLSEVKDFLSKGAQIFRIEKGVVGNV